MHYIAVLHNLFHHISCSSLSFFYRMASKNTYVSLSFLSVFSSCFDRPHTLPSFAERVKVIVGYNFCLYEAALKIAMDSSS